MNISELAYELERLYQQDIIDGVADLAMPEVATMLRQRQAENEELKSKLSKVEEIILDSFNRGKMLGYAEGLMKGKQIGKQV